MKIFNIKKYLLIAGLFFVILFLYQKVSYNKVIENIKYKSASFETKVVNGIRNKETRISLDEFNFSYTSSDEKQVKSKIFNDYFRLGWDYPELFYINTRIEIGSGGNKVVNLYPNYGMSDEEIDSTKKLLDAKVSKIVNKANMYKTDYEKAKYVHDYLVVNSKYDYDAQKYDPRPIHSYRAHGVILKGRGLCQSYALAYKYIVNDKLGIPTKYAQTPKSSLSSGHIWNIVKINGVYYNVDTTTDSTYYDVVGKHAAHKYFMVGKSTMEDLWGDALYDTKVSPIDYGTIIKPSKVKTIKVKAYSKPVKKEVIEWKKVTGAKGYQVYFYRKGFKKYRKLGSNTSKTIKTKTKSKRKYIYRYKVRAYKIVDGKYVYGAFSKVKKVRTK